jgi:HEPN domain-containing protein
MSIDGMAQRTAQASFEWLMHRVDDEIRRRTAAGMWETPTDVYMAQMLFWVDRPAQIRLNSEVRGWMRARAARDLKAGEEVATADFYEITSYRPPEDDEDAAHVTALRHAGGWSLAMSFSYNTARIAQHVEAADEFLATARHALAQGRLRAFAESAFAAVELYAKAELLALPDERLLKGGHRTVAGNYSLWARLGNTDKAFARLLHDLGDLRREARYLQVPLTVTKEQARTMLATIHQMSEHVRDGRPTPWVGPDGGRRSINIVAPRAVRAGELLEIPSKGALSLLRPAV